VKPINMGLDGLVNITPFGFFVSGRGCNFGRRLYWKLERAAEGKAPRWIKT